MQSPPPQIDEGLAGPASATKKASSKRHSYRKRCKSGIYCDEVSLESLLRYTHLPAPAAAKELGMGITGEDLRPQTARQAPVLHPSMSAETYDKEVPSCP